MEKNMENKNIKKEPSLSYNINQTQKQDKLKGSGSVFSVIGSNQKKIFIAFCISCVVIGLAYLLVIVTSSKHTNVKGIADQDIEINQKDINESKDMKSERSFWKKVRNWFKVSKKLDRPSFDIARSRDGDLLITGRTIPNTTVYILKDEHDFAKETSDNNGEFVYIHKKKLPEGNAKFSMYIIDEDEKKIFSEQDIVFYISHEKGKDIAVLVGGKGKPSKVLQAPKNKYSNYFYLQNLDYDDQGNIVFTGIAKKNTVLQIYVDNNLVVSDKIESKTFTLSGKVEDFAERRQYTVRLDMILNGKVHKRMTYKFTPEFFEGKGNSYAVKCGDNLWNIAYSKYGKGSSYVVIFEGNKNQITNPDLIYPNQVFNIKNKNSEFYDDTRKKYYK